VRRFLITCSLLLVAAGVLSAAEDTKKTAETRKALKTKVSFKWKDTPFGDVVDEIKNEVKGIRIHIDNKGGVNNNKPITYECKDKPLDEVLADVLGKNSWGYYVNNKKDAYDGDIYIKVGEERGYLKGEEPKEGDKPKDKPKEEKPKDKPKVEEKPKEEKPKEKPTEDDPDKAEKDAARKLKLAKQLIEDGKPDGARDYLEEIVKKYKDTKAAEEATELLKKLDK
jgi:FimV-like protein